MSITIHVYHHVTPDDRIGEILSIVQKLTRMEAKELAALDDIKDAVEANEHVTESALILLDALVAKIEELKNDPAGLQALADQLKADNEELAAGIVAHTPAEAPPPPIP